MADSSRTIMTDAGFALETRVRADETKMQFIRAAISTDDHFSDTDDALAKLTELSNIQQDGKVTAVQVINTTTVYVQVDVNQAESKADYQMRSAALYAKDDDGTEVLYGVTVLQDPVFVHKDADGSYLGFGINTTVGKASNVVVVVDPANMVTQQVFESTMKNYYTKAEVDAKFVTDDDFASKLPKNIATTDAANTFAKSQTLAGGATDGAGNAIATTKNLADGDATTLKSAKDYADTKISGKADDSTVVHTADMRKPANDVAGIEEVNAKQDKLTITPADDSKVPHLSGANNFDTVPTVNNNPLLLASSLPSDLARTGQDANFTAKLQQNGQDVALANNTIARNPDTGVVSEPTDFAKLTVNGGKSVATSDDLKSLEASAWMSLGNPTGQCVYNDGSVESGTVMGSPLMMKYDESTGTTQLSGGFMIKFSKEYGTWTGTILTLPNGFKVTSLKDFITALLTPSWDSMGTLLSYSQDGMNINASLIRSGTPAGFQSGISFTGMTASTYRQFMTNKTTTLLTKI